MIHKGRVKGNTIVLEKPVELEEGAEIEIVSILKSNGEADPVCGSWKDDRKPEEIISEIRASRSSKNKDIDL